MAVNEYAMESLKKRIRAARGIEKADTVLKNGNVVDVFGHTVVKGDVAVCDGCIVGIGEYEGVQEIDVSGKYIMPGFVDSHVHIESSLLIPSEYARAVLPHGTTTIVADPHEIVNVCGKDGLLYMLDDGVTSPMNMEFVMPSCVPATPFDHAGCVIGAEDMKNMLKGAGAYGDDIDEIFGLGEMMNYPGVLGCDDDTLEKLFLYNYIDGHAPGLSGKDLCAYAAAGILTDHECGTKEEALEKVSKGFYIFIREGTGTKNLEELIKAVTPYNIGRFAFCTDDKHTDEILKEGTIRHCIRKAIKLGFDPISAIRMATLNPARICGYRKRGAVAPGFWADIVVADSLELDNIEMVFFNGNKVAENGRAVYEKYSVKTDTSGVTDTVHIDPVTADELRVEFDKNMPVIHMREDSVVTEAVYRENAEGLVMVANIERHNRTGNIGKAYAMGFDIKNGAVAQTIGHDSHNITVAGDNAEDMAAAVNALGTSGGIAVVKNGEVIKYMPLPIGGIMTDRPAEEAAAEFDEINAAIKQVSPNASNSIFMVLCFISLLVIPHLKLSDKGLFDVDRFEYVKA